MVNPRKVILGGAGGVGGMVRDGGVSESATKAPRTGIGCEEKRGISTILLAPSGSIRAFVADLDNWRRRGDDFVLGHLR